MALMCQMREAVHLITLTYIDNNAAAIPEVDPIGEATGVAG